MDFKKSQALLKKINALHESATAFDGKISKMERDLLLHYLREMYEEIITPEYDAQQVNTPISNGSGHHRVEIARPMVQERKPAPVYTEPVRVMEQVEQEVIEAKEYVPEKPKKEKIKKPKEPKKPEVDSSLLELFDISSSNEIGSRFSQLPISDIGKSMGINDKILTINDLFGGDQNLFNSVVSHLNGLTSFDSAKDYLVNGIAAKNDWSSSKCKGKAEVFIKLIKRRYI